MGRTASEMRRWTPVAVMGLLACATVLDPAGAEEPPVGAVETCAEPEPPEYKRSDWGRWEDADGDCQDTRQEVLIRDSVEPVIFTDEKECRVVSGQWVDPYDGEVVTDPSKIDVDHVVALRDAHDSGAWQWDKDQRIALFNDLDNLKATSASTNRSKGARGPDEWLPPMASVRCGYIEKWLALKTKHGLEMSEAEESRVTYMQKICSVNQVPVLPQN